MSKEKKVYKVLGCVTVGGSMYIEATSEEEAEAKLQAMLDYDEGDFLAKCDITHRECDVVGVCD